MDHFYLDAQQTFTDVISKYQELVQFNPTGLEPMTLTPDPDAPQSYNPSHYSAPSVPDFIADVELAAIRVLDKNELAYFNRMYKTGVALAEDTDLDQFNEVFDGLPSGTCELITLQDLSIRRKLGQELIDSGMSSVAEYLKPSSKATA